ncbi:hypothetical protein ACFWXT_29575, partial [Bacillus cereus]|uniref:hypothetical protein n=1 Tax=Bacillus cereus TaxID=1396 RepID=UPI00366CC76B
MTPWLPLISSLVIASVTTFGILINNHTNRRAITAADERNQETINAAQSNVQLANTAAGDREHDKWRREATLGAVSAILDVTTAMNDAVADFNATNFGQDLRVNVTMAVTRRAVELEKQINAAGFHVRKLEVLTHKQFADTWGGLLDLFSSLILDTQEILLVAISGGTLEEGSPLDQALERSENRLAEIDKLRQKAIELTRR